jgi:FeS assembly SUF system regulator
MNQYQRGTILKANKMIKVSKMADYGMVLLTSLARKQDQMYAASDLSKATGLPLPMVSKVLKRLSKEGILTSTRGVNGGYSLSRKPEEITTAEIVSALDGPIAITRCLDKLEENCCVINSCGIKSHWELINDRIVASLDTISLADLVLGVATDVK